MKTSSIDKINHYWQRSQPFVAILGYDDDCEIVCELKDANQMGIFFKLNPKAKAIKDYIFKPTFISINEYAKAFNAAISFMSKGDAYLLNLCFKTRIETNLTLEQIYTHSNAKCVLYLKDKFVCFSPEPFIAIKDNKITTMPMKGTIDASLPDALSLLLNDKKELSEQMMMTDLMRNDLSIVAKDVKVDSFRKPSLVHTSKARLYQTSSKISGILRKEFEQNLGDLLNKILPAGSITGTPKYRVCEIISQIEKDKRGYFSGVFVYFDGKELLSYVLIRFIGEDKFGLYYHSGGGITLQSDMQKEYEELKQKVYLAF